MSLLLALIGGAPPATFDLRDAPVVELGDDEAADHFFFSTVPDDAVQPVTDIHYAPSEEHEMEEPLVEVVTLSEENAVSVMLESEAQDEELELGVVHTIFEDDAPPAGHGDDYSDPDEQSLPGESPPEEEAAPADVVAVLDFFSGLPDEVLELCTDSENLIDEAAVVDVAEILALLDALPEEQLTIFASDELWAVIDNPAPVVVLTRLRTLLGVGL